MRNTGIAANAEFLNAGFTEIAETSGKTAAPTHSSGTGLRPVT